MRTQRPPSPSHGAPGSLTLRGFVRLPAHGASRDRPSLAHGGTRRSGHTVLTVDGPVGGEIAFQRQQFHLAGG